MPKHRLVSIGVAVLAVVQGVVGVLRAFYYFHVGAELEGRGIIFMPLVGAMAYGRGGLIILVASLAFIFAVSLLMGKGWGWWCGLVAAVLNIMLVLGILIDGEHIAELLLWLVVPIVVIWFLFSRFGWQPGHGSDESACS